MSKKRDIIFTIRRDADRCNVCGEGRRLRVLSTRKAKGYTRRRLRCKNCGADFALVVFDGPERGDTSAPVGGFPDPKAVTPNGQGRVGLSRDVIKKIHPQKAYRQ